MRLRSSQPCAAPPAVAGEEDESAATRASPPAVVVEPPWLQCPITHALYRDPVFTACGHSFERAAVEAAWAHAAPPYRDPLTNTAVDNTALVPNWNLRQQARTVEQRVRASSV